MRLRRVGPPARRRFAIVFELHEGTRWLFNAGDEQLALQTLGEAMAAVHTKGPRPRVTVQIIQ